MAIRAKCERCHIRWNIKVKGLTPLHLLRCPFCKGPVSRTSHQSRLPLALGEPELEYHAR